MFARTKKAAVRAYASFVTEGTAEGRRGEFHGEGTYDSRIVGEQEFVARNLVREGEEVPERIGVDDVISAVCRHYKLDPDTLALPGKKRELSYARGMAAWIVQDLVTCTLKELAGRTARDLSSLSAAAHRFHKRSAAEESLLREKREICEQITICKA